MKIAFFNTKPYDRIWFEPLGKEYGFDINFIEPNISEQTIVLAEGCDAICVFVNDYVTAEILEKMDSMNIKLILLRCAGFNNVNLEVAHQKGFTILRVPSYSPAAVAEFAIGMMLDVDRNIHRAYNKTRDFNMSLNGLMGKDLRNKTVGVIGTGKIGQTMIEILTGFHMKIIAYDIYPNPNLDVEYVELKDLLQRSDYISLHCPLTKETHYLINKDNVNTLKKGVIIVNTSRGPLLETTALIDGLKDGTIGGVALDVYEEEDGVFYEDVSNEIIQDDTLSRLMTFPNVLITSHMGFFTREALQAIAIETLENAYAYEKGNELVNIVK